MTTTITAKMGKKMAKTDRPIEVPVSTVEITGFANPAVVPVDANRVEEVDALMAVAVPPPAMIAKAQVKVGSRLAIVETITAVPAIVANGIVIISKK